MTPISLLTIYLEIFPIVLIVYLVWIIRVFPFFKVEWLRCYFLFLVIAADGSLFFLKAMFLIGC
jgi:hypothetical protein